METKVTRIPISLFQKRARPPDSPPVPPNLIPSEFPPAVVSQTPKKKIILNKRVIPKITIKVDQLIRDTYYSLANGNLKNVTDSPAVLNNDALIDYIRAIYETYDIEDPMGKYRGGEQRDMFGTMTPVARTREFSSSAGRHGGVTLTINQNGVSSKRSEVRNPTAEKTLERTGVERERSTSKRKIQDLKESIKSGGNQEPVQIRTISLSSNRRSSAQIRKKIMYDIPQSPSHPLSSSHFVAKPSSSSSHHHPPPLLLHRQASSVQPNFRFCFMCESPILQANIDHHQKRCPHFLQLYRLECGEIVGMLVQKINRIKEEIKVVMETENSENNTEKDLKRNVERWMRRVEDGQGVAEHEYQGIMGVFERPCFKLLELTYRLRWFLKMRQHIKSKFQI